MVRDVDLSKLGSNAKVFVGRPNGENAREFFHLDDVDYRSESLRLLVPEDLIAINSSFFLGLFGNDVKRIASEDAFFKYLDTSMIDEHHMKRLRKSVSRVLLDIKLMDE